MGIRGLATFLKKRHLRRPVAWVGNQRWGIDCSCLLYRARAVNHSPLDVFASLIVRMRRAGIQPICIFDGRPSEAKAEVLAERKEQRTAIHRDIAALQEQLANSTADKGYLESQIRALQAKAPVVSSQDRDELKQFLYAAGVLFVTAQGEADDLLGALCREGVLHAVVSTDTDMLTRGVPVLIVPESYDTQVLVQYSLREILLSLGLTYDQFVYACLLMGSDYTQSQLDPMQAILRAREPLPDVPEADLIKGTGRVSTDFLSPNQLEKWQVGAPPSEPETLVSFQQKLGWPRDWIRTLA